jgi:valyl-tRNA synthetase
VMSGIHFMGTIPFETIYLHGLVRDEQGRKMSKSLGNVIDPIEVMDQYGTDALRFTLATSSTPGNDMKLVPERIIGNRNFANKIWNAARFVITQTDGIGGGIPALEATTPQTLADRWIVSKAQELTASVTRLIDDFQFGEAGRQIYDFFWSDYCDWYLEIAKVQLQGDEAARETTAGILRALLDRSMRLLHPFMPYVTEEVWQHLFEGAESRPAALIIADWPQADESQRDQTAEADFSRLQEIITRIRDARKQMGVEAARRIPVIISAHEHAETLREQAPLLEFLARTEPPRIEANLPAPDQAMSIIVFGVEAYLPLAGMIDIAQELARIDAEIASTQQDIERSQKMLANEQFVSRARPEVVQKERDKLAGHEEKLAKLQARRKELE